MVAVLEHLARRDCDLLPDDATAKRGASKDPVHAAMAVSGAAIDGLPEGPTELADDDVGAVKTCRADLVSIGCQPLAEFGQPVRQVSGACALTDLRVPDPAIDEAQVILRTAVETRPNPISPALARV